MYKKIRTIHMVGIGGAGMSGIAEVLSNLGYRITGSDLKSSDVTRRLKSIGIKVNYGHRADNVTGADLVVMSSAVSHSNPEVRAALKRKIPVIPRAEMLAELGRLKYTVSIAGTHGKSTTTSMVGLVLEYGGLDPTIIIGGKVRNFGSGVRLGEGKFFVAEADESDGSFLKLSPTIVIVTNIDDDHLDHYGDMNKLKEAFTHHLNRVPFYGCGIVCVDNAAVKSIIDKLERRYYTYGINSCADISAKNIKYDSGKTIFDVLYKRKLLGKIRLNLQGNHNVQNALAAACCGIELGIPFGKIKKALAEFGGVGRRMELKGRAGGVVFLDDYAHHPTEIKVTLETLRRNFRNKRIVAIFQPHRYSRTKILYKKFGPAFKCADVVRLMDIYPAGEKPISGVSSKLLLNGISKYCSDARMFDPELNLNMLLKMLRPGDIVLTLGAGNVWKVNEELLSRLEKLCRKK